MSQNVHTLIIGTLLSLASLVWAMPVSAVDPDLINVLEITNPFDASDPIQLGESIANNGVCLTVTNLSAEYLRFDLSPETLSCTALSRLAPGRKVNLERSLRLGDRLSGHWVQGHVDGVAQVVRIEEVQKGYFDLSIQLPERQFLKYCVKKGSFSLDGISLTIHDIRGEQLDFQIIPHTWAETALGDLSRGESVNFEVELLAKYVERMNEYDAT